MSIADTAWRLGVHAQTFRKWVRQAEIDEGARPGMTREGHAAIVRLRRDVKAAAYFAREAGRLP
ncbi:MAG TPA: transposase [Gaiellales bacterium]|nr:transposase [Gaiellales bacterium]